MLNGKEIIQRGIVTNVPEENIQQHGIDLNLIKVERFVDGTRGFIPKEGKTQLVKYEEITPINGKWSLMPGVYSITFSQGCKIPADQMLLIRQRSSMLRNGGQLHSSVFDAGFQTSAIGTVMQIWHPIDIEVGARIAQIYNHESHEVDNLYDGQWNHDKQRSESNSTEEKK